MEQATNAPRRSRKILTTICALLIGGVVGLGTFTFKYAEGTSYLTNDSQACANCHVMQGHLDAWVKSSHGKFATCNDCHAPHDAVGKYYCKARNGLFHSAAFTTGDFHEPIMIHEYNRRVAEQNCRYCHQDLVSGFDHGGLSTNEGESLSCIRCHADVGHSL